MQASRALFSLCAALLTLLSATKSQAACLNKNGVSVDPSKGPVVPWATEFAQSPIVLVGWLFLEAYSRSETTRRMDRHVVYIASGSNA